MSWVVLLLYLSFNPITDSAHYRFISVVVVLLSLVRTRRIGHVQDLRRWVVAFSRSRLGLYVFGRWGLFSEHAPFAPTIDILSKYPRNLVTTGKEGLIRHIDSVFELGGVINELLQSQQ